MIRTNMPKNSVMYMADRGLFSPGFGNIKLNKAIRE